MVESDGLACVTDLTRAGAEKLDAADPLAQFRDRFVIDDPSLIYMDGNSLGRLPIATERRLAQLIREEWGGGLVRTWDEWLTWPGLVGDRLGDALLGAAPGQVVVSDSTTVNLYKCAAAAIDALPERRVIVTDSENFPTDRYVVEGLAQSAASRCGWCGPIPSNRSLRRWCPTPSTGTSLSSRSRT